MTINLITMIVSALILGIAGYFSYKPKVEVVLPNMRDFPFNQSTGKEKLIQSKTGDASLYTETARRKAIASAYRPNWCCPTKVIKESTHTTGTASGAVEAFILSGFGRIVDCNTCDEIVYDGNSGECLIDGNV
jgi:hypothetical protein